MATNLALKEVARLPLDDAVASHRPLLMDVDHDGHGEVVSNNLFGFKIAKYEPVNRYVLVLSDTARSPLPETIVLGNFIPYGVGDVDRDGRPDVVGIGYYDSAGQRTALAIFEARDSHSYPDSLVWWAVTPVWFYVLNPTTCANLDGDSATDIVMAWTYESTAVFENTGNDRCSLVCMTKGVCLFWYPTIDDYDRNGRVEYTYRNNYLDQDYMVECVGDNRYALVCSLYTGHDYSYDRFAGHDVDRNGRPEYFEVTPEQIGMFLYRQTLVQFEATAEHQYAMDTVDTASSIYHGNVGLSLCADIDGDSLEEIVWSCGYRILILEATGPHQYERVCDWHLPQYYGYVSVCNAADFNGNGYKEIYVGGDSVSFVLEVECIRVLNPDTTRYLRAGDTCEIRWQLFQPPRCDSVSLFLRSDTTIVNGFYRLDTIVTGLSPGESTYSWVVSDTALDSARIVAIAYGPGWQFDESDSAFRIARVGMVGPRIEPPRDWALSVNPNPARGAFTVCYDVPRQCRVSVGVYDVDGRLVRSLTEGDVTPGRYEARLVRGTLPAGIYFCTLDGLGTRITRKVVLTE